MTLVEERSWVGTFFHILRDTITCISQQSYEFLRGLFREAANVIILVIDAIIIKKQTCRRLSKHMRN